MQTLLQISSTKPQREGTLKAEKVMEAEEVIEAEEHHLHHRHHKQEEQTQPDSNAIFNGLMNALRNMNE
jgi:hypothetical protein